MNCHQYQYRVLVEYLTPTVGSMKPDYRKESDRQSLTAKIGEVMEHLPAAVPDGWEVNSHSLTVTEDTVILSILLRRPVA
ncbi:MAG: hypothetical protein PHQ43_03645 [Dehalococcoidales bacterium]|nr:hypothetical protein [Dehalococcoidales bacterium]